MSLIPLWLLWLFRQPVLMADYYDRQAHQQLVERMKQWDAEMIDTITGVNVRRARMAAGESRCN